MSESPKDVEVWQSIIKGWEEMFARQVAETEKWHQKYIELLKKENTK